MTPHEFHKHCYRALCKCPQFRGYQDSSYLEGWGEFSKIPDQGWGRLIKFWNKNDMLWRSSYWMYLPDNVMDIIRKSNQIAEDAINEAFKNERTN